MVKPLAGRIWAAAWLLSVVACAYTDPGTGTTTLQANLDIMFSTATTQSTQVQATVQQGGLRVTDAKVVLTDSDTGQNFSIDPNSVQLIDQYHRRMQVRISAGANNVICQLEGPSKHVITAPLSGMEHSINDDLQVNWTSPDGLRADHVVITLDQAGYQTTLPNDDGWFSVPATLLQPTGNETLTVRRITQVVPAGGTSGSLVRSSFEVKVPFSVK